MESVIRVDQDVVTIVKSVTGTVESVVRSGQGAVMTLENIVMTVESVVRSKQGCCYDAGKYCRDGRRRC